MRLHVDLLAIDGIGLMLLMWDLTAKKLLLWLEGGVCMVMTVC